MPLPLLALTDGGLTQYWNEKGTGYQHMIHDNLHNYSTTREGGGREGKRDKRQGKVSPGKMARSVLKEKECLNAVLATT